MSTTEALTEFLLARFAEDEAVAAAASPSPWVVDFESNVRGLSASVAETWELPDENAAHIARWDPARVLAEVEAKRQIVDLAYLADEEGAEPIYLRALRTLAAVYADHPDYRRGEWRP